MNDKDLNIERAKFAEKDAKMLEDFSADLRAYNWEVEACGRDGRIEYQRLLDKAPMVVKILANYLRT